MRISIASDHAGFELKNNLKSFLESLGHDVSDEGPFNSERSDYPDYAAKVAESVSNSKVQIGVLICGSGIGMCMAANRLKNVRAVVLRIPEDAVLSRKHNDANVACLGARITSKDDSEVLLKIFLSTSFEGGRHQVRVEKIDKVVK